MTPREEAFLCQLKLCSDPTAMIVALCQKMRPPEGYDQTRDEYTQYNSWNDAWDAARDAADSTGRNTRWGIASVEATPGIAGGDSAASLLAGCMVVHDLIAREHLEFAVSNFLRWIPED